MFASVEKSGKEDILKAHRHDTDTDPKVVLGPDNAHLLAEVPEYPKEYEAVIFNSLLPVDGKP